jgi:ribose-phosphate pyrophosphokinase
MLDFNRLFDVTQYPAGERHVTLKFTAVNYDMILMDCRNFDDLGLLVTADNILKRNNRFDIKWVIPYFPFGRHDRRNHKKDGFELGVALEMIKDIDVITMDPHSYMTEQLKYIPQKTIVHSYMEWRADWRDINPVIVIPDQGATKKAFTWMGRYGFDYVQGVKYRDVQTGELSGFGVTEGSIGIDEIINRNCLIVDDICDGGGTFLGLGQVLQSHGIQSVDLAVTHGLFTKGVDNLLSMFDEIWTIGNLGNIPETEGFNSVPYAAVMRHFEVI